MPPTPKPAWCGLDWLKTVCCFPGAVSAAEARAAQLAAEAQPIALRLKQAQPAESVHETAGEPERLAPSTPPPTAAEEAPHGADEIAGATERAAATREMWRRRSSSGSSAATPDYSARWGQIPSR